MKYYGGMDLHSNNTYLGILDEDGRRIYKTKELNYLALILKELEPYKDKMAGVVVESTYNWYWLADGLMEAGYKVHLANPCAIKQYSGLKHSADYQDAFFLADLLRLDILPQGYIYPKEERAIRDLLRKRLMLVRHRTAHILSFQSLYSRQTGFMLTGADILRIKEADMDKFFDDYHVELTGKANISTIHFLGARIKEIEKVVLSAIKVRPEFVKLKTVAGIGDILAMTIALETGDINRFAKVGNFASYCRLVASQRLSNDKKKGQGNRKNGNKYLCWAFIEAANFTRRHCPHAQRFHQRKLAKTNKIVATKALAHKLARAAYFIIRDQVDYDPKKTFV